MAEMSFAIKAVSTLMASLKGANQTAASEFCCFPMSREVQRHATLQCGSTRLRSTISRAAFNAQLVGSITCFLALPLSILDQLRCPMIIVSVRSDGFYCG